MNERVDGLDDDGPGMSGVEDTNIIAFMAMRGHKIKPWICADGSNRVAFDIFGNTSQALDDYYNNVAINVQDFVKNLKMVKSTIIGMKQGRKNG